MLAVHYSERTLLHHLLGPKRYSVNFPMMNDTLQWVIDHHPEFMNRPDKFGTYPIHLALQQLAYCPHLAYPDGYQGSPTFKVGIDQLLAAGADPHVRDGRGNTVLHYVIMAAPTDKRAGEPVRQLLRQFIDMGVDVNLRNHAGWTPFTGVLASWERPNLFEFWRTNLDVPPRDGTDDIDHEVLTMFDEAGADWTMKYSQEQTLLHLLFRAGEGVERATCRARYLLTKSVDPTLHDDNGLSVEDWSITI
jgi:ankyrin repeat protein